MNENKYFCTFDIFLSTTLLTLGFTIECLDKTNRNKVEFCFNRSSDLDDAIQAYWAKSIRMEPQSFVANLKVLKNRIYSYQ